MTNIFIANLDWEISSSDLQATFSAFGEVHLAHVVFDAKTKKSKGFGYVEMVSAEEAIKAIMALNGFEVNGRKLDVKIASPKANRPKPEDKPKPFAKKPGFAKKPYGSGGGQRQGGGGYRSEGNSGGYRSNNNEGGGYRSNNEGGGFRSSDNRSSENRSTEGRTSPSEGRTENRDENRPERVLRPRKRLD